MDANEEIKQLKSRLISLSRNLDQAIIEIDILYGALDEIHNSVIDLEQQRDGYMNEAENYLVQLKGRHNVD